MKLREHMQITGRAVRECFAVEKRFMCCLVLIPALSSLAAYIPVYFSARILDALYQRREVSTIASYVLLAVGLAFGVRLLTTYLNAMKDVAMQAWYRNEDWRFSDKAMEMAYTSVENPEMTRLLYRIRKESQTGYNRFYLHRVIEDFCGSGVKIAASLALCASFFTLPCIAPVWKLALCGALAATVLGCGLCAVKIARLHEKLMGAGVDMNVMAAQIGEYLADYGAGKEIRLYDMGEHLVGEQRRCNGEFQRLVAACSRSGALWAIPGPVLEKGFVFLLYSLLIFGALQGGVSVGSIAKYVACLTMLVGAAAQMARTLLLAAENNRYLKRYFSWLDEPNEMYQGSLTVEKRDDNDYHVEFRDVSFQYPNASAPALSHVNLKFRIGEKLAIVGRNGSGKTTFIKLLCRLYDPTEGEILLNGVDIRKYNYDEYMLIMAAVFQDFKLFSLKLGEVVACGRSFDRERVRECLARAGFGERYRELASGADTCLYRDYDKNGVEISGGEAQKIALARALYKDAPFILLDEPTAALDPVSEYEVYVNFGAISGKRTSVYISHRLASCRFCDRIAVFESGRIVQTGSHKSLLSDGDGLYRELWQAQAQYYQGSLQ